MRGKMKCIVHFQPIERYPPAFNFLKVFANENHSDLQIHLITNEPEESKKKIEIPGVIIHRVNKWKPKRSRISRMFLYMRFIWKTLFLLIRLKPSSLLYYESISAGAPCIYKKWFNSSCSLFIHYHEYISPEEYRSGMILNRWFYKLERSIYKKASWVSHCNEDRMRFFLENLGKSAPSHTYILPNHPPAQWAYYAKDPNEERSRPVGIVYVGALSVDGFFLKEMATWVAAHPDKFYWDIYSDNFQNSATDFLQSLNASNIFFKGAINYEELPALLSKYTIGVILYSGHIPNYIYNVPNKLFEYHVCGLDTWLPLQMISCLPLIKLDTYPKIAALDFSKMEKLPVDKLLSIDGCPYVKNEYAAEKTYKLLIETFSA